MACVSLQATSTGSFHSLFSWEGRENGSNHNALKWKSGLISLSKGSHLPTENIIQLNAAKESSHFKLQLPRNPSPVIILQRWQNCDAIVHI